MGYVDFDHDGLYLLVLTIPSSFVQVHAAVVPIGSQEEAKGERARGRQDGSAGLGSQRYMSGYVILHK